MDQGRWHINVLGEFEMLYDGVEYELRPQLKRLLTYLALKYADNPERRITIPHLLEDLWPNSEASDIRGNLRGPLHELGKILKVNSLRSWIHKSRDTIQLLTRSVECDVWTFFAAQKLSRSAISDDEKAMRLCEQILVYRGDLFDAEGELFFRERERLRTLYQQALRDLQAMYLQVGQLVDAALCGEKLVASDDIDEDAADTLARSYAAAGQWEQAEQVLLRLRGRVEEGSMDFSPRMDDLLQNIRARDRSAWYRVPRNSGTLPSIVELSSPLAPATPRYSTLRLHGRSDELDELMDWLLVGVRSPVVTDVPQGTSRAIVTLKGSPGIGKTRIARELHVLLQGEFKGRAWYVELEGLDTAAMLLDTIARAVGIDHPGSDPLNTLSWKLGSQPALLILDPFEHLAKGEQALLPLLERCPMLNCLIVSRRSVNIQGIKQRTLKPLKVPEIGVDTATMLQNPCIRLFIDQSMNNFDGKPECELIVTAQLCRYLEGIPLSIFLAASRMPGFASVSKLWEDFTDNSGRYSVLEMAEAAAGQPGRHRTLWEAVMWSYNLLSESAKLCLRYCSVFRGGWSLEAAKAILPAIGTARSVLEELVRASLIYLVTTRLGDERYRMLDTLREFGDRLLSAEERWEALPRHAVHCLVLAERAEPNLSGSEQSEWMDRLELDYNNIRAVLGWSIDNDPESETAARIAVAIGQFWIVRSRFTEGLEYLLAAMPESQTPLRARALSLAAWCSFYTNNYRQAEAWFRESMEIWQARGAQQGIVDTLHGMGAVAQSSGAYDDARRLFEQYMAICEEIGDKKGIASALFDLGTHAYIRDRIDEAKDYYERSLALREQRDIQGKGVILHGLGNVAQSQGDYETAEVRYREALAIKRQLKDNWGLTILLANCGHLACCTMEYSESRHWFAESLAIARKLDDGHLMANALEGFACLKTETGQPEAAAGLWGTAEALRETAGCPLALKDRKDNEYRQAAARKAVGDQVFEAARRDGRTWTMERAVAVALSLPVQEP